MQSQEAARALRLVHGRIHRQLRTAYRSLQARKRHKFNRHVSFGDLVSERSQIAAAYGFGKGATCFDDVVILDEMRVGWNTWRGPDVILDSRGGSEIGDDVSVCAGVQIYLHDSVACSMSSGAEPLPTSPTKIGSGVYIGLNPVIQRRVEIGEGAMIGAMSSADRRIPAGMSAWGVPARILGIATKLP